MAPTQLSTPAQPVKLINSLSPNEVTDQFKMNQGKFAQLADEQDFSSLKENLIEIDIQSLLEQMGDDSYFEVTLPITGMTDFLAQEGLLPEMPQQFPSIMAINGFGASDQTGAFHKPYFIMVKDIVGNEYEILVTDTGQIEIPQNGVGLFSMLQSMTFIYSKAQILDGQGFANMESVGALEGKLYLLPPPGLEAGFTPTLGISTLNEYFQRTIDMEMKVPIEAFHPEMETETQVNIKPTSDAFEAFQIDVTGIQNPFKPNKLQLKLQAEQDAVFKVDSSSASWQTVDGNTFELPMGLSKFAKFAVLRDLMSEFDFAKSLLGDHHWDIAHTNGFNDFGLRSEAIGPYYDLLVDMVVQGKADSDYFLSHVPEENLSQFNLAHVGFDADDQVVVDHLTEAVSKQDYQMLHDVLDAHTELTQTLTVQVEDPLSELPNVQVDLMDFDSTPTPWGFADNEFTIPDDLQSVATTFSLEQSSDYIDLTPAGSILAGEFDAPVSLAANHEPTTILYQDIMDFSDQGDVIKGFDMHQDQIDLSGLLESMPGVSEDNIVVEAQGQDVQVGIQGLGEEVMPVATLIGAGGPNLPEDLSQIISNPDLS